MDSGTGRMYLSELAVVTALARGEIKRADRVVALPPDVADKLVNMNRKQRRAWYAKNGERAKLPRFHV